LCKNAPSAYVVPITINNSWKLVKFGMFPMGLGKKLEFIIHEAVPVKGLDSDEILKRTEKAVITSIKIG
jgi:1-acyl-sn-glycerol-3-phosphate acyltransferase